MTVAGLGPCYVAALQAFCENHGIIKTTGRELFEKTGYRPLRCGRALDECGWDRVRKNDKTPIVYLRNGSHKKFLLGYNFKLILSRFEEHYEKVKMND